MSIRNYNKLYVNTDREEGSEKILLGYQNDTREIILEKNKETIFHVPYYTEPINLSLSTLIQDGATAGPYPALSDRIYKNLKNYGKTTINGNPSDVADGTWFCSWLYKDENGTVKWMDRYYNPGSYVINVAIEQLTEGPSYKKHDPVYRDVPSKMILEQGVQYRYFHIGEESAAEMVTTFEGVSGERLKLNLNGWGTSRIDNSAEDRPVQIITDGAPEYIFASLTESDRVSANAINFDNKYKTTVFVEHDSIYNLPNEYTLSFWAHSNDWRSSQPTQLVGNFNTQGGMGVFIDTLSGYPFFVIPETGYGHLVFVNEAYEQFLDKTTHPAYSLTATPSFVAINVDNNVIVCNTDDSRRIRKLDHTGRVLAENTLPNATETPLQVLCGQNDTVVVITNKNRYTYDYNLSLIKTTVWQSLSSTVAAFAYDVDLDMAELLSMDNVNDCKFIGMDRWCLSATDGNLYVKYANSTEDIMFAEFEGEGDTFAIDPYNRLWVLHGTNNVSVYNSSAAPLSDPVLVFNIGADMEYERKNISFICKYNRETGTREWNWIIYYGGSTRDIENPQMYIGTLNGSITKVVDILSLFDLYTINVLKQTQENFEFLGKGDFTGYETRRVFNNLSPFRNNAQLILQTVLKNTTNNIFPYTRFKQYYSLAEWNPKSWQHILVTLKNNRFKLYVNANLVINMPFSSIYEPTYESQPPFYIGSPGGYKYGFNEEIGRASLIFNGIVQDVKIYDYEIDQSKLELFQRAYIPAENVYWSLPTPNVQYIETIERMFKNKIPGAKSSFFNIKLCGTTITDPNTRLIIEEELRKIVSEIKPLHTNFLKVKWVD